MPVKSKHNSKIIHCDCDCFFAAVEIREDPKLRGLPVAVGGDKDRRGVIATCNYEARHYGVRSAMATSSARKLCPDLVVIPPRGELYREVSQQIFAIYARYTDLIEPVSLDEAYLDVSESSACKGSATLIAREIRQVVKTETGLTISAGVAPNKFLAKISSDWNKPDGLFVLTPSEIAGFIQTLKVSKLPGVGPVTTQRLLILGLDTCKQLQEWSLSQLMTEFGSFGNRLHALCRGIDDRPVRTERERKSISVESTFTQDLPNIDSCLSEIPHLLANLETRLSRHRSDFVIGKQFVKIKFADFVSTTVEAHASELDLAHFEELCRTGFSRRNRPVRLLGLGVRAKPRPAFEQLILPLQKK
jgi:DNA polymerase-4